MFFYVANTKILNFNFTHFFGQYLRHTATHFNKLSMTEYRKEYKRKRSRLDIIISRRFFISVFLGFILKKDDIFLK